MTQDEIIEMARQAGLLQSVNGMVHTHTSKELKAFAKLVAERERKEFAEYAVDIARRAVEEEREACALIGDGYHDEEANCGDLIRARGQA
jgi:MoaA/NifB/PqqE/SkfB family radical SAM enzyme